MRRSARGLRPRDRPGIDLDFDSTASSPAPSCCRQSTVELKEDGQRKLWQREYWGSKAWVFSNNRRTYVEGVFGNIKNPSTENLSRGTFRITGPARVTLFLGLASTAHNVRLHRNWIRSTASATPRTRYWPLTPRRC
jgi:hypothetical protein